MRGIRFAGLVAALAALPVSAQAADTCATHAARSNVIGAQVNSATALMRQRDIAALKAMLPSLNAELAKLPSAMPAPLKCGDSVQVYDVHQFALFDAAQKAGKQSPGFAKGTRFTYFDPLYHKLAYIVGWIQYELEDFEAARLSYSKGLTIAPNEHDLVSEYAATLLSQKKNAELMVFVDRFLAADRDASASMRASLMVAKSLAQIALGDRPGALTTARAAKALDPGNETAPKVVDVLTPK